MREKTTVRRVLTDFSKFSMKNNLKKNPLKFKFVWQSNLSAKTPLDVPRGKIIKTTEPTSGRRGGSYNPHRSS